jgi:hypothetical protein
MIWFIYWLLFYLRCRPVIKKRIAHLQMTYDAELITF